MQTEILNTDGHIVQGRLGRHETFTPRYGWLKKGYDAVIQDGNVFKASDAIERLGVGKNMVSSIRFWCQAFKLIEPAHNGCMVPTELGRRLLDDNGWDPFLEDVASLWLLHWQLFVPRLEAVSWTLAFNKCNLWSFDIKQLTKVIFSAAQKYPSFKTISENSFERDASCIIRMYADVPLEKESEIECPFTQLGIIRKAEEKNSVCFDTTEKQNLPPLIFAAACFSYIDSYVSAKQRTISLHRLTYDFNSPGVVFKVPESAVGSYLYTAARELNGISLIETTGSLQLYFDGEPRALYWDALQKYYDGVVRR
ncbi:DUF4007 family protein [Desulfofundulus thermosubterraneus]|uniref:DUF4007 domain-containing protein n=1 Tax=Desulfofundulus thermosubterraneus DSM 16057 TaxID=1121432 RepID=A0A1M6E0V2_9FIRM|nr:DUF4007 family protein [Desulfofundulus thermosubterraneus]SHI78908.1 Protein of unknown function [Desulfofundulus thermosubterraneus DSM 16057]